MLLILSLEIYIADLLVFDAFIFILTQKNFHFLNQSGHLFQKYILPPCLTLKWLIFRYGTNVSYINLFRENLVVILFRLIASFNSFNPF